MSARDVAERELESRKAAHVQAARDALDAAKEADAAATAVYKHELLRMIIQEKPSQVPTAHTDAMVPWRLVMEKEKKYLDGINYQLENQDSEAASQMPQGGQGRSPWRSVQPGGALPPAGVIEMTCPRGHCYHRRFIEIHGRVGAVGRDASRHFECPSCGAKCGCGSFPRGPIDADETNIWKLRYRGRP